MFHVVLLFHVGFVVCIGDDSIKQKNFQLTNLERIKFGAPIKSTLELKNNADAQRTIDVDMKMQITRYIGIPDVEVGQTRENVVLKPGEGI